MQVKHKTEGWIGTACYFNRNAVSPSEMIIRFPEGDMTSDYTKDWDPLDPGLTHKDLLEFLAAREP